MEIANEVTESIPHIPPDLVIGVLVVVGAVLAFYAVRRLYESRRSEALRTAAHTLEFRTSRADGIERLYHWQGFNEERLRVSLLDRTIYCSAPTTFNDPWDCKPHFNTDLLEDPVEHRRHVNWAVDLCRRRTKMSEKDIANMEERLSADRQLLADKIDEISQSMWTAIALQYRVYCLGPNAGDLLMWSHYADKHRGICLEFDTKNVVMCCPLRVEYFTEFPLVKAYSTDDAENLRPLLAKAVVWENECEYRLVAQERARSNTDQTLMTDDNFLKLPEGALLSIIVGCQGPYEEVRSLVKKVAPDLPVKQAHRVPNRFELRIT